MINSQNLITKEHSKDVYFSSFEDKYMIMDNLEEKTNPMIHARQERYNEDYVYVIIVLRGTLHAIVGCTEIEIHSNEYLAILPCMRITIQESKCLYFSFLTRSYIMNDIYDHSKIGQKLPIRAFMFYHLHLNQETTNALLSCYQRIKSEHDRPNYVMKEIVLRAYQTAYIAKLFSMAKAEDIITHTKTSKQYHLFNEFLKTLSKKYKQERSVQSYAKALDITPKYLSTISQTVTGFSASVVIDQYVTHAIKQVLYINEHKIKTISKEFNFPSQSFFGRFFKRITGLSPNEFIKKHNRKSLNFRRNKYQED